MTANSSWIAAEPGNSILAGMGIITPSIYASTFDTMSKHPVTDSMFDLASMSDCQSSTEGGPHSTSNFRSAHVGVCQFVYADGSIHSLQEEVDLEVYRTLSTGAGGDLAR